MGWKELKIDNLPDLTMEYVWQMYDKGHSEYLNCQWKVSSIIAHLIDGAPLYTFAYRKPEPKAPTHEEIMTKWWREGTLWKRVDSYDSCGTNTYSFRSSSFVPTEWFIGRESSILPEEPNGYNQCNRNC